MEHSPLPTYDRPTFPKCEHLKSKSTIEQMFKSGQSVFSFPYKVYYTLSTDVSKIHIPPKVLISVSKRSFKNATDRNRIKRQIKEAYRLNKTILQPKEDSSQQQVIEAISFVYVSRKKEPYPFLERKMKASLYKLFDVVNTTPTHQEVPDKK
ncbi:ribonuclease P protein component [Flammeovirga kamogawensis]|uniref:Ribonuclease P protein component n=1 Tax=Flammeovirga kamogawensis TaxID=373891 RepID=A0ABX8GRL2_9BACT|nr:ribonuclease P protein component [Flammeovirga kamogawensis]MBB6463217.1 ribonuclease P protein component [Flammeovirga kamogawensis]QWG05933.1 ribonuclease P protein component [Flammeovirga kamogawensis]TRX67758.1 ribonuclease P protein component [Flammeovirga kamogawensis]